MTESPRNRLIGPVSGDQAIEVLKALQAEVIKLRAACKALAKECHTTKRAIFPTSNLSTAKTTIDDLLGDCEI